MVKMIEEQFQVSGKVSHNDNYHLSIASYMLRFVVGALWLLFLILRTTL